MLNVASRAVRYVRTRGVRFSVAGLVSRVRPPRLERLPDLISRVRGKQALEIGGPSDVFRDQQLMPVYSALASVDGCNFSTDTMWEGRIAAGQTYKFSDNRPPGKQHIGEAADLTGIPDAHYDVVLSSHSLEHTANPLRALRAWVRVLKPGGTLVTVLPDARYTFDRRRPRTTFAHLLADFEANTDERDLTHLEEILALHDLTLDEEAGSPGAFAARARDNFRNRGLHHHVFDHALIEQALAWAGMRVLFRESHYPFHLVTVSEKPLDAANARG
jgi:SAM-dependent methyltransferase